MQGLRHTCAFTELAAKALSEDEPLRLVDIRASGEPAPGWSAFGERRRVLSLSPDDDLLHRLRAEGFADADALVLDGGPGDLKRLRALAPLLAAPGLLLVAVRADFTGGADDDAESLHNTDRLLREHGFDLFLLEPVKVTGQALPWPYLLDHVGPSLGGRVAWGHAVYAKPPVAGISPAAALKTAALYAMIDLPDQAAEALSLQAALPEAFDLATGLDLLTAQIQEDTGSDFADYANYKAAAARRAPHFFNFSQRRHAWLDGLQMFSRSGPVRIRALEDEVRVLTRALHETAPPSVERVRRTLEARSRIRPGHHAAFDLYTPYRGPSDPPFHIDFIGAKTAGHYGKWPRPAAVPDYEADLPPVDEEYFEWIDLLQTVADAGPVFTMLELGAGYGRWSARAALAARQLGKAVRIGAAEAEPKHQFWLREHLQRNGVGEADYRLFPEAVGGSHGQAAFAVGAPETVEPLSYGQAIMPLDLQGVEPTRDYFGQPVYVKDGWQAILVRVIPLSEVLESYDQIDLVDFDLQGAEGDAIAEGIEPLTRKARRLHVGTHGEAIEEQLRTLLPQHGWVKLRDYSLHKTHDTPFGPATFVDGVQSWINPALMG